LLKPIWAIWLLWLGVLSSLAQGGGIAGIPVCAVHCLQSVRAFSFDYDRRIQAHINYDGSSKGIFDYVGAEVHTANECAKQSASSRTLFGNFGKFLAADTGATKLLAPYTGYQPWVGDIRSVTAASDTTMYRVWGGGSQQAGAWLSPVAPASSAAATESLALPVENTAQFYSQVLVPAGTRYQIGTAAAANGLSGGGVQVQLLERIPLGNYGPGIPLH